MTSLALIGAGGHARALLEMLPALGFSIAVYVDPVASDWIAAPRLDTESDLARHDPAIGIVLGFGGTDPEGLARRRNALERFFAAGRSAPALVHPTAHVSTSARIGAGTQVMAGAIVQPGAQVGAGVIVNTGAIIEHGCRIGDGTHIAPGAVVLGDCKVGSDAMIGAGAVILPGQHVAARSLVKAATRYPQ